MVATSHVNAVLERATQKCDRSGARLTPKRKQILGLLVEADAPLSAYDLVAQYNQRYEQDVKPMSVYRILDFLVENSLVHKLGLANQFIACEHIRCEHAHENSHFVICRQCQKAKEITLSDELVSLLTEHVNAAGYQLSSSQLELDCLCDDCASE